MQEAEVVTSEFVETLEAAPEVFELVEKTLDEVTLFIKFSVIVTLFFAVCFRRNNCCGVHCCNGGEDSFGVIGFITHHKLGLITC